MTKPDPDRPPTGVEIAARVPPEFTAILTREALELVAALEREFGARRRALLAERAARQEALDAGAVPDFLPETAEIREADWCVAPTPDDLLDRRVEITGPVDRKMMINALNSGASVFMADFEDAHSPTWEGTLRGQVNLRDAVERTISYTSPEGRVYRLADRSATLMVRPRGWHLVERHLRVDGEPVSASLFDFGLYLAHNAVRLGELGTGPYVYLAKLEGHHEARLWNDVFVAAQARLGIPRGTIRATVLIENILAAFEMDEILHELREHAAGLNAGRWDYIFSIIRKFRGPAGPLLPDRARITMTVPFMRAYTDLLVKTCHRRGAHAIGGMAAFIPNRRDPGVTERALKGVREDKERESRDGFDGTWIAHPGLVETAREPFDAVLGDRSHQKERLREAVEIGAADLLDFEIPGAGVTEAGFRLNINVALQYIDAWLRGTGAAGIFDLMEDTATAEISRAQLWQWIRRGAALEDGRKVDEALYRACADEETARIRAMAGRPPAESDRLEEARRILDELVTGAEFTEFLTGIAYEHLG